ncbi:MAG: urease accessory protein UreE [Gammaproteobacteria bacterium HGW-Gammaproteobacteria-3]|nr:MAG: urease accessory protein UreE [Gammaproteobacteria bacterium HGW-Gammaproteobacteria-3]
MLKLTEIAPPGTAFDDVLTLPFELRQKSRLAARTDNAKEVGLFLARGQILRSGMILRGFDHFAVQIKAAHEPVSVVRSEDCTHFAKACYHLGNRHVPLQILAGELRYLQDHVLDHMLEGLGLKVMHERLPFEPEAGAYQGHDH